MFACHTIGILLGLRSWAESGKAKAHWYHPFAVQHVCFLILSCVVEHVLDSLRPEEQHGFRRGNRLEKHLVTANLVVDNFCCWHAHLVGQPWFIQSARPSELENFGGHCGHRVFQKIYI